VPLIGDGVRQRKANGAAWQARVGGTSVWLPGRGGCVGGTLGVDEGWKKTGSREPNVALVYTESVTSLKYEPEVG
jgi:hypothetical protein